MRHLGCGQFQGERARRDFELLLPRVQLGKTVHYLPILFIDQLSNRVKDLMVSAGPQSCGDSLCLGCFLQCGAGPLARPVEGLRGASVSVRTGGTWASGQALVS